MTRYSGGSYSAEAASCARIQRRCPRPSPALPSPTWSDADILETQLSPGDAGRIEAELRGRGATVVDTIWGTDVTLHIAINPSDRESIDACLAQASSGVAKFATWKPVELN